MRRILALAEGRFSPLRSKTANAALVYLKNEVAAVIDSTKAGMTAQDVLGYGGAVPVVASIREGLAYTPDTLLIGIAPPGGRLPLEWRAWIIEALEAGLDICSGLHTILSDDEEFRRTAERCGRTITDWRKIPPEYEVVAKGTWKTRRARTVLTVGSDCNIGKMTTILEVQKEFARRGIPSDFIGTGQTGIMISGRGVAVDAVISDYIAGSIERAIDEADQNGHAYLFVEGQGALTHQGYSGVTYGLLHGTMPDAMILCHQPTRLKDDFGATIPDLPRLIRLHEDAVRFFKPTKVVAIGVNSIGLTDEESMREAEKITRETGLPAVDAFRFGAVPLADALLSYFQSTP
ncbi:MAG: DUF1611 domain-containing protein [Acidobacteriota bacterium]